MYMYMCICVLKIMDKAIDVILLVNKHEKKNDKSCYSVITIRDGKVSAFFFVFLFSFIDIIFFVLLNINIFNKLIFIINIHEIMF